MDDIKRIPTSQIPKGKRGGKIERTPLWVSLAEALNTGLPPNESLKVGFKSVETLFKTEAKAAWAFAIKLRTVYGDRYKIRLIGKKEIYISALKEAKKSNAA